MEYGKYAPKITVELAKERINKMIERASIIFMLITLIEPTIKGYDGKKITKHISTAVQKTLDQKYPNTYRVYYNTQYGMYHIDIWSSNKNIISSLIGYSSDQIFNFSRYIEYNQCYYLDGERVKKYKESLNHIDQIISDYNDIIDQITILDNELFGFEISYILDKDYD